jgi:hypothetical protein
MNGEDEAGDDAIELHHLHFPDWIPRRNLAQRRRVLLSSPDTEA